MPSAQVGDPKVVGSPLTLANGVTIQNRTLKSAMTERLCTWGDSIDERGKPSQQYLHLYEFVPASLESA